MGEGGAAWQAFRPPLPLINKTRSDEREDGRLDETWASEGKDAFACANEPSFRFPNTSPFVAMYLTPTSPAVVAERNFTHRGRSFRKFRTLSLSSSHSYWNACHRVPCICSGPWWPCLLHAWLTSRFDPPSLSISTSSLVFHSSFSHPPHCHTCWSFSCQLEHVPSLSSSFVRDNVRLGCHTCPSDQLFIGGVVSPWDSHDGTEAPSVLLVKLAVFRHVWQV